MEGTYVYLCSICKSYEMMCKDLWNDVECDLGCYCQVGCLARLLSHPFWVGCFLEDDLFD